MYHNVKRFAAAALIAAGMTIPFGATPASAFPTTPAFAQGQTAAADAQAKGFTTVKYRYYRHRGGYYGGHYGGRRGVYAGRHGVYAGRRYGGGYGGQWGGNNGQYRGGHHGGHNYYRGRHHYGHGGYGGYYGYPGGLWLGFGGPYYGGWYDGYADYGYSDYAYYDDGYDAQYSSGGDHVQWCLNRYRSYNPRTDTYMGYDGLRHVCRGPY
jgi:hypothetical protein